MSLEESISMVNEYYVVDGVYYISTFPYEWALNHKEETGPIDCLNCMEYGVYRGLFIGYCANCAINEYNGEKGRGFISHRVELPGNDHIVSVYDTYLKDIDLDLDLSHAQEFTRKQNDSDCEFSRMEDNVVKNIDDVELGTEIDEYGIDQSQITEFDIYGNYQEEDDNFIGFYGCPSYGSNFNGGYDSY